MKEENKWIKCVCGCDGRKIMWIISSCYQIKWPEHGGGGGGGGGDIIYRVYSVLGASQRPVSLPGGKCSPVLYISSMEIKGLDGMKGGN